MAIHGKFEGEKRWISREDFFKLKDTDPYVAFCFSFANDLKTYAYSKEIEPWKKALHYARVFNDYSLLKSIGIDSDGSSKDIKNQYDEYKEIYGEWSKDEKHFLELQSLERLRGLESLESLEITNQSYEDYTYLPGDVVYCDPPYENTKCGHYEGFDSDAFYQWVLTRPFQVFFSSYELKNCPEGLYKVWSKKKRVLSSSSNRQYKTEVIYSNQPYTKCNEFIFGV